MTWRDYEVYFLTSREHTVVAEQNGKSYAKKLGGHFSTFFVPKIQCSLKKGITFNQCPKRPFCPKDLLFSKKKFITFKQYSKPPLLSQKYSVLQNKKIIAFNRVLYLCFCPKVKVQTGGPPSWCYYEEIE